MDIRPSASQRGYGARWQALRADFLRRNPLCKTCEAKGRVKPANEVDHIKPRAQGGSDADANLQSLCKPCHSRKTAQTTHGANQRGFDRHGNPMGAHHHWTTSQTVKG